MLDIREVQEDFNKVVSYSQGIKNVNSTLLLEKWAHSKETLYHLFGDKFIYNCGKINILMNEEEKHNIFMNFTNELKIVNSELYNFILDNEEGFFDNKVVNDFTLNDGTIIPKGMRILKAFKFFLDKEMSDKYQTKASMIIQNNVISGDLCFSIHPLDYLSSSENTYNWRSCHSLNGEYRAGNLSYMMDRSTIVCYIKGDKDDKLPRFPLDVPWNNKKWRMLLFLSEGKTCMMAGRQYPMNLGTNILDIILEKISVLLQVYVPKYCWEGWHNDQITDFKYSNRLYSDSLKMRYIVIDGYIYKLTDIVKDIGDLHFNDLLRSSCYIPYYCWNSYIHTKPSFVIGGEVPCLVCEENYISNPDSFMCDNCMVLLDDEHIRCDQCDEIVRIEDAYWIENERRYVCQDCFETYYDVCGCCGGYFRTVDMRYNGEDDRYYCEDCYEELKAN